MSSEPTTAQQEASTTEVKEENELSKEQQALLQQQENDASDDEEFLSDSAEIVDSNDLSNNLQEELNLDLTNGSQKVWLVRLPKFLAAQWRNRDNLHGQELGKIRIRKSTPVGQSNAIQLTLNDTEETKDIPHNYQVQLTKSTVENQYIFSEKNLTDYSKETELEKTELDFSKKNNLVNGGISSNTATNTDSNTPAPNAESNNNNNNNTNNSNTPNSSNFPRRRRKFNKFKNKDGSEKLLPFVKTIPKKTALIGTIVHECQVIPSIDDPNYSKLVEYRKKMMQEAPRPTVTLLNKASGVSTLSNAGLTLKTDQSTFLKTSVSTKNKNEGRAIRMPQKDLLDLLFKLFDEYDYWSLKGLKDRTKQPEVYLKETLDQIATLIKKGPYSLKYALKKEYKELKDQERAARLGDLANDEQEEESEEEKEDDIEMEDIV